MKQDPLKPLREIIGRSAVRSLQNGITRLKIWRRSSPHNWYVENSRGYMLWHSEDHEPRPDLSFFDKVKDSEEKVSYGNSWLRGSDDGSPELSEYRLKAKYRR